MEKKNNETKERKREKNYLFDNIVVFVLWVHVWIAWRCYERRFILFSIVKPKFIFCHWYGCSSLDIFKRATEIRKNLKFRNAAGKMRLSSSSWGHATAVAILCWPPCTIRVIIYGTDKTTKIAFIAISLSRCVYFIFHEKEWKRNGTEEKYIKKRKELEARWNDERSNNEQQPS